LAELPDARLEEDFAELLEAERLRRLAEIDRRRIFARDGHLSAASWLVDRFRMAWDAAKGCRRHHRLLRTPDGVSLEMVEGHRRRGGHAYHACVRDEGVGV